MNVVQQDQIKVATVATCYTKCQKAELLCSLDSLPSEVYSRYGLPYITCSTKPQLLYGGLLSLIIGEFTECNASFFYGRRAH